MTLGWDGESIANGSIFFFWTTTNRIMCINFAIHSNLYASIFAAFAIFGQIRVTMTVFTLFEYIRLTQSPVITSEHILYLYGMTRKSICTYWTSEMVVECEECKRKSFGMLQQKQQFEER